MDARRWFQVIPAFFARAMSKMDMLACPFGECRDSERSESAQTPDMALRINHLQERKVEKMSMKQEKNTGSRFNQHPGRPDYKADSRRVNGQYRNPRMVCRTANLPRRARRGV